MTFHDILPLGDLGDGGSMRRHLLMLEEVRSEGSRDEDVNLILRLETRRHLFIDDLFGNGGGGGIRVFREEFLCGFDCHGHGILIINMLSRTVIVVVITVAISFVPIHGIFKVRLFLLRLLVLFLLLFLLLLVFGLFLLLLLFLLIPIAVTVLLRLLLVLLLTRLLRIGLHLLILRKNVGGKLMGHIHHFLVTTGRALVMD
mmetsp:Transcript_25365/g.53031  ORF Transcript_25365/g.53031 Transcript_25365/m.53031 type:complete len:201 (+) Transcript_25365:542-1144(+)